MRCHGRFTWLIACLCLLAGPSSLAQQQRPTIWVPITEYGRIELGPTLTLSTGQELTLGDPALGQWAIDLIGKVDRLKKEDLLVWMHVVRMYRISEAESVMFALAEQQVKKRENSSEFGETVYWTLAVIAQPPSREKLRTLLKADLFSDQFVMDQVYEGEAKARIAAALVRMNDDVGRNYLIGHFISVLTNEFGKASDQSQAVTREMSMIGDVKLLGQVKKLRDKKVHRDERNRSYYHHMISHMQALLLTPAECWNTTGLKRALTISFGNWRRAWTFAERGGLEDLVRLQTEVKPTTTEHITPGQVNDLIDRRDVIIRVIQCRLWRELAQQQKKPAD